MQSLSFTLDHSFVCGPLGLRASTCISKHVQEQCITLSTYARLWQKASVTAVLSVGQLFPPTVQIIGETSDYNHHLYNAVIQEAVAKAGCTNQTTLDVSAVVYKGTKYVKGYVSIVDDTDDGLVSGKIAVMLDSYSILNCTLCSSCITQYSSLTFDLPACVALQKEVCV